MRVNIYFLILQSMLFSVVIATSKEVESCSLSNHSDYEKQCGQYCYKIVKTLLNFLKFLKNENDNFNSIIEGKDRQIAELQAKLTSLYSNEHKPNEFDSLRKLITESNTAVINELRSQFLDFHNNGEIKPPYDSLKRCQNESTEYNTKVNESKGGETYIESPYPNSCVPFGNSSKQYKINVAGAGSFHVLCDAHTAGPGWITIQRRADGKVDFDRDWNAYRNGFGSLNGDFFIGLEKLHYITKSQPYELYVHLKQLNGQTIHARYDEFAISNEKEKYNLIKLDLYSGTAGDYLKTSKHTGFSTKNKVNIQYAKKFNGGWWFNDYTKSNLNGKYVADNNLVGMFWGDLKILNLVKMLIRPKV